jgi:hypothetical protein
MKTKEKVSPITDADGNVLQSNREVAENLNNFFCSVFTDENISVFPICMDRSPVSVNSVVITTDKVSDRCSKLKVNKAPGVDNISPRIIQELAEQIKVPLTYIFESSLRTQVVPEDWRTANVTPLYKKGPRDKSCNYRPVSLTSIVGKIRKQ